MDLGLLKLFRDVVFSLSHSLSIDGYLCMEANCTYSYKSEVGHTSTGTVFTVALIHLCLMLFCPQILDIADVSVFVLCPGECQNCPEDERLPND